MEYTDKAKQIVHEAEISRQHARYKIPAKIEINGKIYDVYDWSVSGVGIINLDEDIYKQKYAFGRMIFKFDDFETVIDNLHLEFVSRRNQKGKNITGARFTELTPQQISILNQIISAYLAGDIVTKDDIVHAVTRANFVEKKEKKPEVDKSKGILILLLIWLFIGIVATFILYVMYIRIYLVKSENAYFDANITVIRAPSPSYIELAKNIRNGLRIKKGQNLMFAHLIYGGVQVVKSPLDGLMYKILIHNGDFRNVGEPVMGIFEKNYKIYIVANILHKDLKKIHIGDIARVELANGEKFYAKVKSVEFPFDVIEQKSKPLQNVYNQARNYDKVILYPINYIPSIKDIGSSVTITIDTFLNKHDWYKLGNDIYENNKTNRLEGNVINEDINITSEYNESNNSSENEVNNSDNTIIFQNNKVVTKKNNFNKNNKKAIYVKKYCIIAAFSNKPFKDKKSQNFLKRFNNAKIIKIGDIYALEIESFDTVKEAKELINKKVKKYYKDAFIIKCKVKQND